MSLLKKIATGSVVSIAAIAGWSYINNLKKTGQELQALPRASVYQISWKGLILKLDVLLKNPTKGSLKVKFPFVKLLYKDTVIGSSQSVDKEISIPPFGEAHIDAILIQIPVNSFFSVVFNLIKALMNKETIQLTVRTLTHLKLSWMLLPYESKTEVIVKK